MDKKNDNKANMYKDKSQQTVKKQSLPIILVNFIFRLVGLIARFFFKNVIYGKKGPAVKFSSNLLLLEVKHINTLNHYESY